MKYSVTNNAISMNQLELQDICDAAAKFALKRLKQVRLCNLVAQSLERWAVELASEGRIK